MTQNYTKFFTGFLILSGYYTLFSRVSSRITLGSINIGQINYDFMEIFNEIVE